MQTCSAAWIRSLPACPSRVFQRRVARSPSLQSRLGVSGPQWGWDDVSDARAVEDAALVRGDLERLARFDHDRLTPEARLSAEVFAHDARDDLLRFRWRHHHYPVCQMRGPQRSIPHGLINNHPIASREDAQARALAEPSVAKFLEGHEVRKVIVVPGKIVNIVVA